MPSGFKVNDYITLKLEEEDTNIYIREEYFRQCKYLLLNIPITQVSSFADIKSIDEAAESLDHTLDPVMDEEGNIYRTDRIPPEVEFWGHCSNLQVWYENDYDTRLLHRNLAFPLLKKLTEVGDPLAKKVFKSELAKRIDIGNKNVIKYLILERYIDFLEIEELEVFTNFQPFIDTLSSLIEEEFLNVYKKALEKHGLNFQFLRKNEKAFPVAFSLQRIRDKALDLLKKILENIIIHASYNSILYLRMEDFFYILDYQNFPESINSHIIKELDKGVNQNSRIVFNQAFLMLVSLSYGTHEERDGNLIHRFRLKDNLHLRKNLLPEQYTPLINNIARRLLLYYENEEYRFYQEAICDFFSSFGEYAFEGLTYLFKRASGELKSIAQKCLIQIKTENPSLDIGIQPKVDINIETILKLNSREIKTLFPSHTGEILVESVLLQFYKMPQSDTKWEYFDGLFYFFEKIGKEGEIQLGNGVMSILAKGDLEITELLIELKILDYLTVEEALLVVQNLDFVRDLLKVLEKQDHYEAKSKTMERLSKFFEKLKGNIDESSENKILKVFEEFPSTFQNVVVKLHLIAFPTIVDLTQLFQRRITDSDLFDYFFIDPFFKSLASQKEIVEKFLLYIIKNQDRKILEGVLDSGFLYHVNKKDLVTFNADILENFIPLAKRVFSLKDNPEELSHYSYDYEWDFHDNVKYLEKLFNETKEIRSFISLPKEDFKNNLILLDSLIKKKYIQYLGRDQFWDFFPQEATFLKEIEVVLRRQKVFKYRPDYRINSSTHANGMGFSLKDKKIIFASVGYSKLNNTEITRVLEILLNITSIERLELNHNQFTVLPEFISNFKNLKYLILTYAGIKIVPETIGDMPQLIHLALNYNKLTTLPDTIGNLRSLQSMYLNNNSKLEYLPESIGKLVNITDLSLSWTGFKRLPESFSNLKSLKSLRLERGQISELPETIGEMSSLSSIYLSETPIKKLPDAIGNSKSIETIDISNTQIKNLPESIKDILSLKEIIISKSYLNNLHALRRLMAPLRKKEVQILFKDRTLPSSFVYFTNKLEGNKPYSKQLY